MNRAIPALIIAAAALALTAFSAQAQASEQGASNDTETNYDENPQPDNVLTEEQQAEAIATQKDWSDPVPTYTATKPATNSVVFLNSAVNVGGCSTSMMDNFYAMCNAYKRATGRNVQVNSGFRTTAEQAALKAAKPNLSAEPGYSMHEFGFALDINSREANELDSSGLLKKYGFTRPVRGETWHIEPIAIQTAKASIRRRNADGQGLEVLIAQSNQTNQNVG